MPSGVVAVGSQLRFVDRQGRDLGALGTPGDDNADLEPSGRRLAVMRLDETTKVSDLWIYDLERGVRTRFTSEPTMEIGPVWSPDGRWSSPSGGPARGYSIRPGSQLLTRTSSPACIDCGLVAAVTWGG